MADFGGRYSDALGGTTKAAGGLLRDLPIELQARRRFSYWFLDFLSHTDFASGGHGTDTAPWIMDNIGNPAANAHVGIQTQSHGVLQLNAGTTSSTGFQLQLVGTTANAEPGVIFDGTTNATELDGKLFAFEARLKADTVANGSVGVGLVTTDTSAFSTAGAWTVDDMLGFTLVDGGTIAAYAERGGNVTSNTSVGTTSDDTYVRVGMRGYAADISSSTSTQWVEVYVDGIKITTLSDTTNGVVPDAVLVPTLAVVNDAANDIDAFVDYFWVCVER